METPIKATIHGYFDFIGDRHYITKIDGDMLVGITITKLGKMHRMHISRHSVDCVVLLNDDVLEVQYP